MRRILAALALVAGLIAASLTLNTAPAGAWYNHGYISVYSSGGNPLCTFGLVRQDTIYGYADGRIADLGYGAWACPGLNVTWGYAGQAWAYTVRVTLLTSYGGITEYTGGGMPYSGYGTTNPVQWANASWLCVQLMRWNPYLWRWEGASNSACL